MADYQDGDHIGRPDPPPREQPQPTPEPEGPLNWARAADIVSTRKIDMAMWATRLLTLIFAVGYVFPIFGNPVNFYYKSLLANAATSALRLQQRIPVVTLSRAFLGQLLMEDSCHYLLYSLIFVYSSPMTIALIPSVMFALLHFASFSLTLLDALGRNSAWIARVFISLIEYKSVTILRMAAGAEIFTMLFTILYPLLGRSSLFTPFFYYRFLTLRYSSRRNHYTRTMFYELRILAERFAMSGKCPGIIAKLIRKIIDIICRFAPAQPAAN